MKLWKRVKQTAAALWRYIFRFSGLNRRARRRLATKAGQWQRRWYDSALGWWYRARRYSNKVRLVI